MVKEKGRFNQAPRNFAIAKAELLKKKVSTLKFIVSQSSQTCSIGMGWLEKEKIYLYQSREGPRLKTFICISI